MPPRLATALNQFLLSTCPDASDRAVSAAIVLLPFFVRPRSALLVAAPRVVCTFPRLLFSRVFLVATSQIRLTVSKPHLK